MKSKQIAEKILAEADITIGGTQPWDIVVHNEKFYDRVLTSGSVGLGESYVEGWWDVPNLDEFFFKIIRANLADKVITADLIFHSLKARIFNLQKKSKASEIGKKHYDIGNDLYKAMLDKRMVYTCGYWKDAQNLDEAQEKKLDLVCRKVGLKPGMKVLDIGCGWGSFMKFAAEKYGVSCVGITVSGEQIKLGRELCKGLPVEFKFMDYRDVSGKFDRVVSLGMFEHVGRKNYKTFMKMAKNCLADDGLFLLHTIGGNKSVTATEPWIDKYIFPNGLIPSISQIGKSIEKIFVLEDFHSFGSYYDLTLMAWFENFNKNWDKIKNNYGDKFYRMWKYYLLSCAGAFRARDIELWQLVLSPKGILGGYESIR